MIKSKKEYKFYLQEDRKALTKNNIGLDIKSTFHFLNPYHIDLEIWKFQKALRKCEYLYNMDKRNFIWKIRKFLAARQFKNLSLALSFTINPNCFGPGLRIMHRGPIIVNGQCKIGSHCSINAGVNIGVKPGFDNEFPILGNNVYIGPGAKLYGPITIANGCIIGANSVVNKSFTEKGSIIVGAPAKSINAKK